MGIEQNEASVAKSGTSAELRTALLDGTWNRNLASASPGTASTAFRTDAASGKATPDSNAPTFVNSDGSPASDKDLATLSASASKNAAAPIELASMSITGIAPPNDVVQVSDSATGSSKSSPILRLQQVAHNSVGSADYGNRVPKDAREFPDDRIEINHQCASTSSDFLMAAGMMNSKNYQISVGGIEKYLLNNGFKKVDLKGDFDASKFPEGPIGFITGKGNLQDGSNHIAFVEKSGGEVRIIHNNFRTGKVIDQNINEKFYDQDGSAAYRKLMLFMYQKSK